MPNLAAVVTPVAILNAISGHPFVRETRGLPFGPGKRDRIDLYAPSRSRGGLPVIVFFYGGGWEEGDRHMYRFVGNALAARGFLVAIPDYRVFPEVRFPGFVEDGARAVRWVRDHAGEHGGNPQRLVLAGHSAGAHIAAMLALDTRWLKAVGIDGRSLAGLIGLSGPYDFLPLRSDTLKVIFGPPESRPASQPINYVTPQAPRVFLGVGDRDRVVDPKNTTRLAARLREAGASVVERHYQRLGHAPVIASFAWPFRWIAPVLRESADFARSVTADAGVPEGIPA